MKKRWLICLSAIAMVLTLCFGIAACGDTEADADKARAAIDTIKVLYEDNATITNTDYQVFGQVKGESSDTWYDVVWTASSTAVDDIETYVKIGEMDANTRLVNVSIKQSTEKEIPYTLKATVTVGSASESAEFARKIEKGVDRDVQTTKATLSFASKDTRTSQDSNKQVWEQNGIKFTNDKASSSTAVGDYANPVRLYQGSKVTIEFPGIIHIDFFSASNQPETYDKPHAFFDDLKNSLTSAFPEAEITEDATLEHPRVSVEFQSPMDVVEFSCGKQLRLYSIDVEGKEGGASDADKVASVKATLALSQVGYFMLDSATLPAEKNGVNISWKLKENSEYASVAQNTLTISKLPEKDNVEVVLVATLTLNDVTETKELTVTIKPAPAVQTAGTAESPYTATDAKAVAKLIDDKGYYSRAGVAQKVYVKGYVVDKGKWDSGYGNWTNVYIADSATSTKDSADALLVYRLVADGTFLAKEDNALKVGATITVCGFLQNYGDKYEVTYNGSENVTATAYNYVDDRTADQKITDALEAVPATLTVSATGETALPVSKEPAVTFSWALKANENLPNGTTFENGKLNVTTLPEADTPVVFVVTAHADGGTDKTQELTVTIKAKGSEPAPGTGDGTVDHPYSVAEATAIIAGLGTETVYKVNGEIALVYVKGIVTVKGTTDDYGIKNYFIADVAGDTDHDISLYSLNWGTVKKGTEINVGDTIIVTGYLQNFNGTYEVSSYKDTSWHNGTVEAHTPVGGGDTPTPPPADEHDDETYGSETVPLSVSAALALAEKECVNNSDWTAQLVYMTGKVKNVPGGSGTAYSNIYLTDKDDSTKELLVFKVTLKSGVAAPAQNDILVISGYITRFSFDMGTDGKLEFSDKGSDVVTALSNTRGTSKITLGVHSGATVNGLPAEGATNGETVTFTVAAESNKEIVAVKLNGTKLTATQENSYSFTVAGDAEITVETKDEGAPDASVLATFTFGTDKTTNLAHADGSSASAYSETDGTYTLTLSGLTRVYKDAYDAKGHSCIKLGTGSAVASFTFAVPADITKVLIYVAGYKGSDGEVTVNGGTAQSITTHSNDGEYTAVEIDTSTVKSITFATTSTVCRAMVDKIEFWGIASTQPTPSDTTSVTFDASKLTYEANHDLTSEQAGDVTITFSKGTGSNNPIFHSTSKVLRIYNRNTFTVTAPAGNVITKITFTFASGEDTNEITPDKGAFESPIWTGSTNAVTFTIGGTSGHRRISQLVIEYKQSTEPEHVHKYTYEYNEGEWTHTGTCNEAGCDETTVTAECTPAYNICPDCKHEFTQDEILTKLFASKADTTMKGTYSLTGKVLRIDTAYASNFGNVTFTMKVGDKEIQCFREKSSHSATVKPGDTVTVQGTLKHYYNGTKEFDAGCEITALSTGELTDEEKVSEALRALTLPASATADVTLPTTAISGVVLTWASDNVGFAIDANTTLKVTQQDEEVTLKITVTAKCGEAEDTKDFTVVIPAKLPDGAETATVSIAEYASQHAWKNQGAEVYDTVTLNDNIEAKIVGMGNTGKYYSDWRIYQTGGGGITITAKNGYTLYSVKVTYSAGNSGILKNGDAQVVSDVAVRVEGTSVTLMVGNTGSATNGQAKITAIEVIYVPASPAAAAASVAPVAILPGKQF